MAKKIMIQGTTSNAGKSLTVAGLCRILKEDGYKVAPFKPQNMSLNSYITNNGFEIGRAQAMQAEACQIEVTEDMNPILLKPTKENSIQVIVKGKVVGNMSSMEYNHYKKSLREVIKSSFAKLEEDYDIIVIEGAGSPAEINIENDISNMVTAEILGCPVIIVGDIDKGGVFASLYGTIELQEPKHKKLIKGTIINKYRGNKEILEVGVKKLEQLTGVHHLGTQMYIDVDIEEEDGVSERFNKKTNAKIVIGCIKLPHISNFTDLSIFERIENVGVNYIENPEELENVDLIVIPGSKNTIYDLKWLKEKTFDKKLQQLKNTKIIFGICGGYQILGKKLSDPWNIENGGNIEGLGLLNSSTVFEKEKTTLQVQGKLDQVEGKLKDISNQKYKGYEIHNGVSTYKGNIENKNNIYGTYIHGIFDTKEIAEEIVKQLIKEKKIDIEVNIKEQNDYKEEQYTKLAKSMRENLDIEKIIEIMR